MSRTYFVGRKTKEYKDCTIDVSTRICIDPVLGNPSGNGVIRRDILCKVTNGSGNVFKKTCETGLRTRKLLPFLRDGRYNYLDAEPIQKEVDELVDQAENKIDDLKDDEVGIVENQEEAWERVEL